MNRNVVVTLDINYDSRITDITFPYMMEYAKNIGADFLRITEKKFPTLSISLEKFQLYDISQKYEWIIFLDADCLVNPKTINFTELDNDIVIVPSYNEVEDHFFDELILEKYNLDYYMPFFFLAFHTSQKNCVFPWENPKLFDKFINLSSNKPEFKYYKNVRKDLNINQTWFLDEFLMNLNIVKYGISTISLREDLKNINTVAHSSGSIEEKISFLSESANRIQNSTNYFYS